MLTKTIKRKENNPNVYILESSKNKIHQMLAKENYGI